ncbi:hypothetical protein HDC94_001356 [Leifsonia sp. AK011]|nr:hypothetical protein [Leifsonia sp. AK011]
MNLGEWARQRLGTLVITWVSCVVVLLFNDADLSAGLSAFALVVVVSLASSFFRLDKGETAKSTREMIELAASRAVNDPPALSQIDQARPLLAISTRQGKSSIWLVSFEDHPAVVLVPRTTMFQKTDFLVYDDMSSLRAAARESGVKFVPQSRLSDALGAKVFGTEAEPRAAR